MARPSDRLTIYPVKNKREQYATISVRIKVPTAAKLEKLAAVTGNSRNAVINMLIDFGIEHCIIGSPEEAREAGTTAEIN